MRRIVLATVSAVMLLVGTVGIATARSASTGEGTFDITQSGFSARELGNSGLLSVRWMDAIEFHGALEGSATCSVYGLQSATGIDFIGWCRYTGTVGDSAAGSAFGPSFGRVTFAPFGAHVRFALAAGTDGLSGLRLTGEASQGTYTVSYRIGGG